MTSACWQDPLKLNHTHFSTGSSMTRAYSTGRQEKSLLSRDERLVSVAQSGAADKRNQSYPALEAAFSSEPASEGTDLSSLLPFHGLMNEAATKNHHFLPDWCSRFNLDESVSSGSRSAESSQAPARLSEQSSGGLSTDSPSSAPSVTLPPAISFVHLSITASRHYENAEQSSTHPVHSVRSHSVLLTAARHLLICSCSLDGDCLHRRATVPPAGRIGQQLRQQEAHRFLLQSNTLLTRSDFYRPVHLIIYKYFPWFARVCCE